MTGLTAFLIFCIVGLIVCILGFGYVMKKTNRKLGMDNLQGYWQMRDEPGRYVLIKNAAIRVIDIASDPTPTYKTIFSTDTAKFSHVKSSPHSHTIKVSYKTATNAKFDIKLPATMTITPFDGRMVLDTADTKNIELVRDNQMSLESN
jgi:hypothetical protein